MLRFLNYCYRTTLNKNSFKITRVIYHSPARKAMGFRFYSKDIDDEDDDSDLMKEGPVEDPAARGDEEVDPENTENGNKRSIPLLGGGLEKLQGGLMEENYFNNQNKEIIRKLHENGQKANEQPIPEKIEEQPSEEWNEFEKSRNTTKWSDSSSLGRQKNPVEEKYFLDEQLETLKILSDRIREEKPQDGGEAVEGADTKDAKEANVEKGDEKQLKKDPSQPPETASLEDNLDKMKSEPKGDTFSEYYQRMARNFIPSDSSLEQTDVPSEHTKDHFKQSEYPFDQTKYPFQQPEPPQKPKNTVDGDLEKNDDDPPRKTDF